MVPGAHAHAHAAARNAALALPSIGFSSVYMKLWHALTAMAREPHPLVAQMANDIINYVANQVDSVGRELELSRGSTSLPPSPNTRPSPIAQHTRTLPVRRGKAGLPHTISEDSVAVRARDKERDSTSSNTSQPLNKPIVSTQFVEWASAQFAAPECGSGEGAGGDGGADCEARAAHQRAWRRARNASLRREAAGLRNARVTRLETQAFHYRCPLPPTVVLFHPYEQHAAVASKDNFGIFDWGTGAKLCVGSWQRAWGRLTALDYLNAHEHALLAAASHTGNLAIYRPTGSSSEPALAAAWRALDVRPAPDYRPPPAQAVYSLAQLVSEQFSSGEERQAAARGKHADAAAAAAALGQGGGGGGGGGGAAGGGAWPAAPPATLLRWSAARRSLALAGRAPAVRLWDADTEMLQDDIHTESESAVTSLWRGSGSDGGHGAVLVCGFGDGAVRAWDERCARRPLYALHHHAAPVLAAAHRPDRYTIITGCSSGEVRFYDTRKLGAGAGAAGAGAGAGAAAAVLRAPAPLAAISVHPLCDLLACGSVNQGISIYDLKGAALQTIKCHEGFMAARIGPVSCLTFHPLRCAMGVGSKDSTVSVYVPEARR